MDPYAAFKQECAVEIGTLGDDPSAKAAARQFMDSVDRHKYAYHFEWMGRPIIQYPQDMVAIQELIWAVKPDLVIETGIAHGGSLILSASMLALLDLCEAEQGGQSPAPGGKRKVLGVDIDIRPHNKAAIEAHPMASRIHMIQGSSVAPETIAQIRRFAAAYTKIMVFLDSNHTHEHVLGELNAYADLTSVGSYCVVFDTVVEEMPEDAFPNRPWRRGNSPMTAVREFLAGHSGFEIDHAIDGKLMITVAPQGFLKRVR